MLLFYNANGDLLKSVLEPVYQGSNNANTIYFIAPISANNVVFLSYILPNGDLGVPKVLTITQPPETLPQESFGNFRVWKIQVDEDLTRYPGTLKVSFLARGINEQLYHNITFAELNIEVLASGNFVMPSSPPNDNVYNEILIALGSLQEVIVQNSDDISQLKNDVESLGNDLDEAKEQIEANETDISFLRASVNEAFRTANNAERIALNVSLGLSATNSELQTTNIKVANLEDVVSALSSANLFEIVNSLPTANINPRVIYLVQVSDPSSNNYYEEYIYVNGAWELIGTTKVDLVGIEYNSLNNMPIFNSSDGIFGIQRNINRSLQNNDYFKYIGAPQNNLGLEKGLVYIVKIVNGVKSYIPINGDRDYINLINKPIIYSSNGNEYVNDSGELVYINPPCYIKYVGEVFDANNPGDNPHSLTPNIIYFVEEVNNVWTYKPINGSGGSGGSGGTTDYDYLNGIPIYNSYNGLDYEKEEATYASLPFPCYIRYTGETDTSTGLEKGKIYYATETLQGGAYVKNYAPINATDVQINGTSITENGVANIPFASTKVFGVTKFAVGGGFFITSNGETYIHPATKEEIKNRATSYKPISPNNLDYAVKIGMTTNKETWTEEEKANARALIGASGLFKHVAILTIPFTLDGDTEIYYATIKLYVLKDNKELITLNDLLPSEELGYVNPQFDYGTIDDASHINAAGTTTISCIGISWDYIIDGVVKYNISVEANGTVADYLGLSASDIEFTSYVEG